jgi:hypothetical protein
VCSGSYGVPQLYVREILKTCRFEAGIQFYLRSEILETKIRGNSVRIAKGYWLDSQSSNAGIRNTFFLFIEFRQVLGSSQPPIQWVLWAISLGVWQRREAYHSPPSSAESRMVELYLHYVMHIHGIVLN